MKSWTLFPNQSFTRWTLLSIEIFLLSLVDKCLTFMNFNTLKYTKLMRLSLHSDNLDECYFVTVRNSLPYWITSLSSMLQFNKYFAHFVMIEFSFIKNFKTHAGFNSGAVIVFNIHVASTYLIASINLAGVEVEILSIPN